MDKRLHVYRPDLADARLQGQVEAERFVSGTAVQFAAPCTPVHRAPQRDAMQLTQALMGETALVFDKADGWAWVQLDHDQYVGYVRSESLSTDVRPTTHRVNVAATLVYPKPDLKTQPAISIPMNAKLAVIGEQGQYSELATGGFVFTKHTFSNYYLLSTNYYHHEEIPVTGYPAFAHLLLTSAAIAYYFFERENAICKRPELVYDQQ